MSLSSVVYVHQHAPPNKKQRPCETSVFKTGIGLYHGNFTINKTEHREGHPIGAQWWVGWAVYATA